MKKIKSEAELIEFGEKIGKELLLSSQFPVILELIGDVGVGKTTLTRGIARGLGVKDNITSPSFSISKRYPIPETDSFGGGELIHYDFYRLSEPGIMKDELTETIEQENAVIIIEWGDSVRGVLPKTAKRVELFYTEDGREIKL